MSDDESPFWAVARGETPPPPAAQLLGWKVLEAEPVSGRIRVQFEATAAFTNPLGKVQGGFLAAMLDETLGPYGSSPPAVRSSSTIPSAKRWETPGRTRPFVTGRG